MITPVQVLIENHGRIAKMQLPMEWFPGEWKQGPTALQSDRDFFSAAHPNAHFKIFYRGFPISDEAGAMLLALLGRGDRLLLRSELAPIAEVLDWQASADDFKISMARAETINGQPVLVVEGRDEKRNHEFFSLYIPSEPGGTEIQELHYHAPREVFLTELKAIKTAISSIEWVN